jgi:hypothetical protein
MRFSKTSEGLRNRSGLHKLTLQNTRSARRIWAASPGQVSLLKTLTREFQLSVALGELRLLEGRWYVTHGGLMRLARRNHCAGINVRPMREFCNTSTGRWVFRAVVYKTPASKGFVGYGDADPSNTSPLVRGAEMRVAETRAVNRALRKAYGIGLCSVEELGSQPSSIPPPREGEAIHPANCNGAANSQPRLRDQLCLLIRQHNLDPTLVKAYAADFCGTETLKEASRDLVESFVTQLAASAKKDREALVCKLNSYAQPVEAKP